MKDDSMLFIAHISNPEKSYLPPELEEEFLYEEYKTECLSTVILSFILFLFSSYLYHFIDFLAFSFYIFLKKVT